MIRTHVVCSGVANLKILRIVRLTRLVKMLRMLRAARIFHKWESSLEINYNRLALAKFAVIVFFMAHWLACAWHMTIVIQEITDPGASNWLEVYPNFDANASVFAEYIASLYWAVVTLSTMGCVHVSVVMGETHDQEHCLHATWQGMTASVLQCHVLKRQVLHSDCETQVLTVHRRCCNAACMSHTGQHPSERSLLLPWPARV